MRPPCGTWGCDCCGSRKAARVQKGIARVAEREKLTRFWSLTLDPKKLPQGNETSTEESLVYAQQCWKKFQVAVHRRCPDVRFVRVPELQGNGRAHLHVLTNKWIPHWWLQKQWESAGGGRQVNVVHVDAHRASRYVAPYLRKGVRALPAGVRRFSSSVGMRLMEKQGEPSGWKFTNTPVSWFTSGWDCGGGLRAEVEQLLSGCRSP